MPDHDLDDEPGGLGSEALLANEVVLQRWHAPGGRGILTNLRCVLLGHPHQLHRRMRWVVGLENVKALSVEQVTGLRGEVTVMKPEGGDSMENEEIGPLFGVMLNETAVYIGGPKPCSYLQSHIDDARTQRCISVYGRLLPFQPGPPKHPENAPDAEPYPGAAPAAPVAGLAPGAPFVLFIAGEPKRDATAGQPQRALYSTLMVGSTMPVEFGGADEPGDSLSDQVYGPEARDARYVLAIAMRCGAVVKLVDVDRPGDDAALMQSAISDEDVLPCLVRSDGQRLSGEALLAPSRLEAFLRGSTPAQRSLPG
jgi:hypothetical protein